MSVYIIYELIKILSMIIQGKFDFDVLRACDCICLISMAFTQLERIQYLMHLIYIIYYRIYYILYYIILYCILDKNILLPYRSILEI